MYKLIIFAAFIASVRAGGLTYAAAPAIAHAHVPVAPAVSYAAGPALGAPLLGSVSYTAPEVSVVKQPYTIDQPEVRYHAVPRVVQTAPIVKTTVVQSPPIHKTTVLQAPSPVVHKYTHTHHTVAAAPAVAVAPAAVPLAAAPAPAVPLHAHAYAAHHVHAPLAHAAPAHYAAAHHLPAATHFL